MDITQRSRLRAVGWLTVISALAGTALAIVIMAWPKQVPDTRWSYPFDAGPYTAFQISFSLHDITLLPGLVAAAMLAWHHVGRAARAGLALTVISMAVGAVIELAGVTAAESSKTSTTANVLGTSYGLMSLGFGAGFIMAGIAFARRPIFPGVIGRWTYLLIGVWTFFPMLPSLFMPMVYGRITIGLWFLFFAGIGVSLVRLAADKSHALSAPMEPQPA
jgi:hypothetical protein